MEDIIKELKESMEHELRQIGMTPHTYFKGTKEEHDQLHQKRADDYQKAIKILSSKYKVRDWMCSEIHDFNDFNDAKDFYDERIQLCDGGETDVELYAVIEGINNVD